MDKETMRQILTNFNMLKLCAKMVPNSLPVFNHKTNTDARTRSILTRSCPMWLFSFPKIENFSQRKMSIRKRQSYFKCFHKLTTGDASRPERLVWGGV